MRIVLTIPDGIVDAYQAHNRLTPEQAMAETLARFAHVKPDVRVLLVFHDHLQRLEKMLGLGSLQTAEQLCERTERLAKIDIGGIEIPWSAAQLEELKNRAAKNNLTADELAKNIVRDMGPLFFTHV